MNRAHWQAHTDDRLIPPREILGRIPFNSSLDKSRIIGYNVINAVNHDVGVNELEEDGNQLTRDERIRKASHKRRQQDSAVLREQILASAGEVFLERGYEHFSMRQVAERIGYSATTIYNYFENKDDLLFAVVDQGFEHFTDELRTAAASEAEPAEKLDAIGEAYVRFGLNNPMHYELMFMRRTEFLMVPREGESQPRISAFLVLQQAIREAVEAGVLPPGDVLDYSAFFWAHVHGIVSMTIAMPHFTEDFAQRAMRVLHRLL